MGSQNPDVIVIGAGVAGLAASQALRRAGLDVIVLEAAGHSGGRCVTDLTTFSQPFDRGGSWLHSAAINPLARIAEQQGIALHKKEWSYIKVHADGHDLGVSEVADYNTYYETMWEAIDRRGASAPDTTMLDAMPDAPWKDTVVHTIAQMVGANADVTSARDSYNYADAPGDWLVAGGLGDFVQSLHADVRVRHTCRVAKIDYSGQEVAVATSQGTLKARHVIVTVSTGVLAAQAIEFIPPLPASKRDAIAQLPNGLLNKIGIEFDPAWASAVEGDMIDYHTGGDAFCTVQFGFYGTNLAVGFVAGRFADALEREGPGAATDFCLNALGATFGSDISTHIRKTDETAWRGNVNTRGSYSYAKPGGAGARRILAQPVAGKVHFAGEATMTDTYSTVHGAYLSGQRVATQVIAQLSPHLSD
ncbi:MAG: flavin monoamine oxidase family protein [Sedimentitalea sp.]